ncbi:MAG: hypothetical protein ACI8PT_001510 [Gammaproteobacteria bacterium]|jgi:hypothetical protein
MILSRAISGWAIVLAGLLSFTTGVAGAANVKVTPLGSHDGEFC